MLEATNLTCIRDERVLFSDLSFAVNHGDIVQIEGPNGAGKTSLLRLLAGLSSAERGEVRWQESRFPDSARSGIATCCFSVIIPA